MTDTGSKAQAEWKCPTQPHVYLPNTTECVLCGYSASKGIGGMPRCSCPTCKNVREVSQ